MKKLFLLSLIFMLNFSINGQGRIRIAYVDMNYILEKLPEYQSALKELDNRAEKWKAEIEKRNKQIDDLKAELEQEKVLLTQELLQEKEEEIAFRKKELLKYQLEKFGPEGDYILQKQYLVTPVQDRVFAAVSKLIQSSKYDIVFDKSNDNLGLVYTSNKIDISDKVLKIITKERNKEEREKKSKEKRDKRKKELSEAQKKRKELAEKRKKEREEKRKRVLEERKKKREAAKAKQAKTENQNEEEVQKTASPVNTTDEITKDLKKESAEQANDTIKKEVYGKQLTPEQLEKFKQQEKEHKLTPEELAAQRKKATEERRQRILEERRKRKEQKQKEKEQQEDQKEETDN